jgi:hypothetical protein
MQTPKARFNLASLNGFGELFPFYPEVEGVAPDGILTTWTTPPFQP